VQTDGGSGTLRTTQPSPPVDPYQDLCRVFGEGPSLIAFFIPDPLTAETARVLEGRYQSADTVRFAGVPPGRYRIIAAENLSLHSMQRRANPLLTDREFLLKLSDLGTPVVITSGQHFDLEAPVVTEQVQQVLNELGIPMTY
jgi:hypothetical protein